MSTRRQTRRSISVTGDTYKRARAFCERAGLSVSGYLERIIAADLDARGFPAPETLPEVPRATTKPRHVDPEEIRSQHFTF